MKLELSCYVDGFQFTGGAAVQVPEPFIECFQPLRVSDDALLSALEFGAIACSATHERRLKLRRNAAEIIAKQLTDLIIEQMEAQDTVNGYKVVKP